VQGPKFKPQYHKKKKKERKLLIKAGPFTTSVSPMVTTATPTTKQHAAMKQTSYQS
jgi:hypothetical protein